MSNLTFNNIAIETNYMAMPQFWGSADPIVVTSIPNGVSVGGANKHRLPPPPSLSLFLSLARALALS